MISADIEQVLMEDLGASSKDLFKSFDETPIAAASLAQARNSARKRRPRPRPGAQPGGLKAFSCHDPHAPLHRLPLRSTAR